MVDIVGLYQGLLLDAAFAGIPFAMLDSRQEPGRRVIRFLFPGADVPAFQDLGQLDESIDITGLIVADDYVEQAQLLRAAMLAPGPATLLHPWLGEIRVMQTPGKPPSFAFRQDELRVARFQASFVRFAPPPKPTLDTLGKLLLALDNLQAEADALLASILAPVALTIAAVNAVESFAATMIGTWTQALGALVGAPAELASAVTGLGGVVGLGLDLSYGATVGAILGAPSAAVGAAAAPALPAAVAPGGPSTAPVPIDPRAATSAILTAVAGAAPAPSASSTAVAIALAAQALAVADAVSTAAQIPFDSQQEAMQWAQQLAATLSAVTALAAQSAAVHPRGAGAVWRALVAAQAALSADLNSLIGRLPSVTQFVLPHAASAWQIAWTLAGDTPDQVAATYLDLVQRNGIVHPGVVPPGTLEVLIR